MASKSRAAIRTDAYTAILPPFECPPTITAGASPPGTPADRSRIEERYFAADSCDGTGQRNAILKSSFQPSSVPSVPRKAIYSKPPGPKESRIPAQSPRSKVIAANCCSRSTSSRWMYSPTRKPRNLGLSATATNKSSRVLLTCWESAANIEGKSSARNNPVNAMVSIERAAPNTGTTSGKRIYDSSLSTKESTAENGCSAKVRKSVRT